MSLMLATKIEEKWHLPGILSETLCGLHAVKWEFIGSANPVCITEVYKKCYQLAMNEPIVIQYTRGIYQ